MLKTILIIACIISFTIFTSYIISACKKDDSSWQHPRSLEIPTGFPAPVQTFADNPLTEEGIELGRRLFYDGRLSVDGMHPCSSCHQQIAAFGTFEHDRSHGVNNTHTLRNAPVLVNLAWNNSFHWDAEFNSLEEESVHPITGSNEMGDNIYNVVRKLEQDITYRRLFQRAFRTDKILFGQVQKALAQFTGSLVSANSKYDRVIKGTASFTAPEARGYLLYQQNCSSCHPEPLFTDHTLKNNGLPVDPLLNDYGRMRITGLSADSLKFKVPTLRNAYVSANFMHDGRFNTLLQCINHYRTGVQQSATLEPSLSGGIALTNAEATDIAVFIRTLTDSTLLFNPKLGPPD